MLYRLSVGKVDTLDLEVPDLLQYPRPLGLFKSVYQLVKEPAEMDH